MDYITKLIELGFTLDEAIHRLNIRTLIQLNH